MSGNGAAVPALRALLLVLCCLPLCSLTAGESWVRIRSRARRAGGLPQLFQLGPRTYLACMLLNEDEMAGGGEDGRGEGPGGGGRGLSHAACSLGCTDGCYSQTLYRQSNRMLGCCWHMCMRHSEEGEVLHYLR